MCMPWSNCPIGPMDHQQEVADRVVAVALRVAAHRLAVAGMGQIDAEVGRPRSVCGVTGLAEVLAAGRVDQPVRRRRRCSRCRR